MLRNICIVECSNFLLLFIPSFVGLFYMISLIKIIIVDLFYTISLIK